MSDEQIESLNTEGFLFEGTSIRGSNLRAYYGDGYGEGAVIGSPAGLRKWKVKIAVLPHTDDYNINAGEHGLQTRALYLWRFYERHNVANAFKPFWVRDPLFNQDFLAEIVEEELDYAMLCRLAYATGLTLRQRRVHGVESQSDPNLMENNDSI
ncbi:MAG: hypothetical protein LC803_16615 [Acidobacteria bacterium]|nr:hypothetical protein [Acidobacteriota bacterium]